MTTEHLSITRRTLLGLIGATSLAGAFPVGARADEPVRGGTLIVNVGSEYPIIASVANTSGFAYYVSSKVNEGLLTYDFDLNPLPELATEWSISEDGLRYWFKLREGVKWHDGEDFDAEDVVFSIKSLKKNHPRGQRIFLPLREVNALGSHEVELLLDKPAPYLIYAFAGSGSPIVPAHLYEGTDVLTNPHNTAPVGTGPFKFGEWVRGSHIVFDRNPNYWQPSKPYLDSIIFRFITDPAAQIAALETGEVGLTISGVPPVELERLGKNPDLQIESRGYGYNNTISRLEFNLDNPHLAELKVRQAIAHAIDIKAIVELVYLGHATPIYGPVSPGLKRFYYPDLPRYEVDLEKAEALLDEAGFPRGADGWRFPAYVDPVQPAGPYRQTAELIVQGLNKIGIKATLRTQDFATYVKRVYTDRDFDIAVQSLSNLFDPVGGIQGLYWSKGYQPGVAFLNSAHYNSPEVDALLEAAAVETDFDKRYKLYVEFQKLVVRDLPALNLVAPDAYTISSVKVRNHTIGVEGFGNNGANIYIAK
ncbi:ABC transporter substrate-binding protein [Rhizobium puerariae]|uniref:ABC transporter substrate-binding protein n=1 Tax=Rhizobium puerariae TaxID=1585791 RepID=A0ABV6AT00_9HYPH